MSNTSLDTAPASPPLEEEPVALEVPAHKLLGWLVIAGLTDTGMAIGGYFGWRLTQSFSPDLPGPLSEIVEHATTIGAVGLGGFAGAAAGMVCGVVAWVGPDALRAAPPPDIHDASDTQ